VGFNTDERIHGDNGETCEESIGQQQVVPFQALENLSQLRGGRFGTAQPTIA
jgi:hypothetical protein